MLAARPEPSSPGSAFASVRLRPSALGPRPSACPPNRRSTVRRPPLGLLILATATPAVADHRCLATQRPSPSTSTSTSTKEVATCYYYKFIMAVINYLSIILCINSNFFMFGIPSRLAPPLLGGGLRAAGDRAAGSGQRCYEPGLLRAATARC